LAAMFSDQLEMSPEFARKRNRRYSKNRINSRDKMAEWKTRERNKSIGENSFVHITRG